MLRLALPSDGELSEPTRGFLQGCGLRIERPSQRTYTGEVSNLPDTAALFQRASDITGKVEEGSADLGIVGLDRYLESYKKGGDSIPIIDDLGYGRCELVIGVPEGWIDIFSIEDLAELSLEFRSQGRELRVASKYPRLVQDFLMSKKVTYFSLVQASGALEAAPVMGYADIIADISSTGVTLRENKLKTIAGGVILKSQACLIGNRKLLGDPEKLSISRSLLELLEGHLRAGDFYHVTANLKGKDPEELAHKILQYPEVSGIQGPTVARVYSKDGGYWHSVSVAVRISDLTKAVERLRQLGGSGISVVPAHYVFVKECYAYQRLLQAVESA